MPCRRNRSRRVCCRLIGQGDGQPRCPRGGDVGRARQFGQLARPGHFEIARFVHMSHHVALRFWQQIDLFQTAGKHPKIELRTAGQTGNAILVRQFEMCGGGTFRPKGEK